MFSSILGTEIINLENFGRIEDDSRIVFDAIRRIQGYEDITVRESFDLLFNGVIPYENSNTQIVDTFNNFVGYRHDELFVALNFAKEFNNVNPNIIGLSGHSLGGVPVIEIDGKVIIVGYDVPALKKYLNIAS